MLTPSHAKNIKINWCNLTWFRILRKFSWWFMIYHKKQSNKLIKLVSLSHDSSLQENNKYYHRKYVTTLYNSDSEALSCVHSPPALFIQKQNIDYQKNWKNIITYKIDWKCMYVRFVSESRSYIWYDKLRL